MSLKWLTLLSVGWFAYRRARVTQPSKRTHDDSQLDEALDETFPASDPPAMTSPTSSGSTVQRPH